MSDRRYGWCPKFPRIASLLAALLISLVTSSHAADSFSIDWFTVDGGGSDMSGGGFTLSGTVGQADAGLSTLVSGEQFLKSGYWALDFVAVGDVLPTLRIQFGGPAELLLSWYPDTPGFSLQQSAALLPGAWSTIAPTMANPATLPLTPPRQFFRLIKP